jgi:hypothetical protein
MASPSQTEVPPAILRALLGARDVPFFVSKILTKKERPQVSKTVETININGGTYMN